MNSRSNKMKIGASAFYRGSTSIYNYIIMSTMSVSSLIPNSQTAIVTPLH